MENKRTLEMMLTISLTVRLIFLLAIMFEPNM